MSKAKDVRKTLNGRIVDRESSKQRILERMRRGLNLPSKLPENLIVKIADTTDEFDQAYQLVYQSYLDEGLMAETAHQARLTKYHTLPTTSVLIAKVGDQVVGTLTIIQDSFLKLPIDNIFDISTIRQSNVHTIEISSFAIDAEWRGRNDIIFCLTKYCLQYSFEFIGADAMVIAVHPTHQNFYEALYFFDQMPEAKAEEYQFVENAPAVGLVLTRDSHLENMLKYYGPLPAKKNLFRFTWETDFPELTYPVRNLSKRFHVDLDAKMLQYFFSKNQELSQCFSGRELSSLYEMYQHDRDSPFEITEESHRKSFRFPVVVAGIIESECQTITMPIKVKNVSDTGCMIVTHKPVLGTISKKVTLNLNVFSTFNVTLPGEVVWSRESRSFGIYFAQEANHVWKYFLNRLQKDALKTYDVATETLGMAS